MLNKSSNDIVFDSISFQNQINTVGNTLKKLEESLKKSAKIDNLLLKHIYSDKMDYQGLTNQLQEAQNDREQFLNILQQKDSDKESSRKTSRTDLTPSCSTMSIVHLQYKYEELLANQDGLLKMLNNKTEELKKMSEDNQQLRKENELIKFDLTECKQKIDVFRHKILVLKSKKNSEINKLKEERETLKLVHKKLVNLLHDQCMEKNCLLSDEIKNSSNPEKAILLQEIRKNNLLLFENFQLCQEIDYLRGIVECNEIDGVINKSFK